MERSMYVVVMLVLCLFPLSAWASESLTVLKPQSLVAYFGGNGEIAESPALFGVVPYGRSITGTTLHATPGDLDGCTPIVRSPSWPPLGVPIILLIDRGSCMFVTKVRHAQNAGAQAAVIVDNLEEGFLPFMADDGTGNDIVIPSMLISMKSGQAIKDALLNTTVSLRMSWNIPVSSDGVVQWKMWTSPSDPQTKNFKQTFTQVVASLGSRANFTANFEIVDGASNGCVSDPTHCGNTCTNKGRYCSPDPDTDPDTGLSGADVVGEALRQICILEEARRQADITLWWEYAGMQNDYCGNDYSPTCTEEILTELRGPTIAGKVMMAINECIRLSGGLDSGVNTKLAQQVAQRATDGIFWISTIIVNNQQYRGGFTCEEPVDVTVCGVLEYICSAYSAENRPCACESSPGCPLCKMRDECAHCGGDGRVDVCGNCLSPSSPLFDTTCLGCDGVPNSGKKLDVCGLCDGRGDYDACHRCLQPGDPDRIEPGRGGFDACGKCFAYSNPLYNKTCVGCDNVPRSGKVVDACGICGGDGSWDACFHCFQSNDMRRVDPGKGGFDACGECRLYTDPGFNKSCAGCDGIPFSDARRDKCGVCRGTGTFDACKRCLQADDPTRIEVGSYDNCGVCLPNNDSRRIDVETETDACGVCRPKGDPQRGSTCKGCDGIPNSNITRDECGMCGGTIADASMCPTEYEKMKLGSIIGLSIISLGVMSFIGYVMLVCHRRRLNSDVEDLLKAYDNMGGDGGVGTYEAADLNSADPDQELSTSPGGIRMKGLIN
eukprot:gb/GEZN01002147.1/.p1 GENE.gb/GEZN01002147.1/~~gb/GEZN01002147.1/.p1  ORF type:complete len:777 (+),score=18.07 gb/GEZN01002147.1/:24-2354(+)